MKKFFKLFLLLSVFICSIHFSVVKADDTYHYNVFDVIYNGGKIGSGEYTCYMDPLVANDRIYVREITINFAAYWTGEIFVQLFSNTGDYFLVEGASINSATSSRVSLWLRDSNHIHMKVFSTHNFDSGWILNGVLPQQSMQITELSPGDQTDTIIDLLDTSNDNWTSMLSMINDIKTLFGTGDNIQNVDVDSIRGMLHTIRSEILAIGVLDGVIANKVGELSGIADNIELLLEQIGYIAANVQVISDSMDLSDLETAITDLETAINNLSGSINVTNNIDITNVNPLSMSAFLYFSKFNGFSMYETTFSYPSLRILGNQNNNGSYLADRRIYIPAKTTYLLAFIVVNNADITSTNFPMYNYNNQVNTVTYSDTRIGYSRLEKVFITNDDASTHTVSFDLLNNNTIQIIPLYLGDINAMSADTQQLVQYQIPTDNDTYYTYFDSIIDLLEDNNEFISSDLMDKLDDVISAIDHISLNVDYDEVNSTVNNFNVDIDTVHNTEISLKNSFSLYRQRFNNTNILDDVSWFNPVLFNNIFNSVWSLPHVSWILTLILFLSLIVAMVGIRK